MELHQWRVIASEFAWRNSFAQCNGFADLVLSREEDRLVLECKKAKPGSEWVFLVPTTGTVDVSQVKSPQARVFWIHREEGGRGFEGWGDGVVRPVSHPAQFCAVSRHDGKAQMLEPICNELLLATEAIARAELSTEWGKRNFNARYMPVIVTNALLSVCAFDPNLVSVGSGEIPPDLTESVSAVPYIRFTKSLLSSHEAQADSMHLEQQAQESTRTVLVVSAESFSTFLNNFSLIGRFPVMPWREFA
jgi:hypothetical protein